MLGNLIDLHSKDHYISDVHADFSEWPRWRFQYEPAKALTGFASIMLPGWTPRDVQQQAHTVGSVTGKAWFLHLDKGGETITLFYSRSFSVRDVVRGERYPSDWK